MPIDPNKRLDPFAENLQTISPNFNPMDKRRARKDTESSITFKPHENSIAFVEPDGLPSTSPSGSSADILEKAPPLLGRPK